MKPLTGIFLLFFVEMTALTAQNVEFSGFVGAGWFLPIAKTKVYEQTLNSVKELPDSMIEVTTSTNRLSQSYSVKPRENVMVEFGLKKPLGKQFFLETGLGLQWVSFEIKNEKFTSTTLSSTTKVIPGAFPTSGFSFYECDSTAVVGNFSLNSSKTGYSIAWLKIPLRVGIDHLLGNRVYGGLGVDFLTPVWSEVERGKTLMVMSTFTKPDGTEGKLCTYLPGKEYDHSGANFKDAAIAMDLRAGFRFTERWALEMGCNWAATNFFNKKSGSILLGTDNPKVSGVSTTLGLRMKF